MPAKPPKTLSNYAITLRDHERTHARTVKPALNAAAVVGSFAAFRWLRGGVPYRLLTFAAAFVVAPPAGFFAIAFQTSTHAKLEYNQNRSWEPCSGSLGWG